MGPGSSQEGEIWASDTPVRSDASVSKLLWPLSYFVQLVKIYLSVCFPPPIELFIYLFPFYASVHR